MKMFNNSIFRCKIPTKINSISKTCYEWVSILN